ncbi:YraN family protein [Ovoidimarina sediminis]|uniref:YraN family protein n=1 Tax=Ovoidimarina sediminis TaxID=3079856 RepID=UPI00290A6028|nr:YraN family protein [Rhodophyticola sp. MJ-SS7]MDU8943706.1 YraN family protein [Rhodophyticola sp. MJ-SS7]
MSGYVSYRAGLAAEESICAAYRMAGHAIAAERWRCAAGEIDLIARDKDMVIFIEVKRAKDTAAAAERLRPGQVKRLLRAAETFLGDEPRGTDTPACFDVALVDAMGRFEIIENALAA